MITTLKSFRAFILISFLALSFNYAHATHVAGGYIQFECTGTPGQYTVTLRQYRDCSGTTLGNNAQLNFTNNCGGINNFNVNLTRQSVTEVSQICSQQLNQTECKGGNLPGYEEHVYTATVNLAACDTWDVGYSLCCRNGTQNLNGQPQFFVTTQLNTATDNCNTTPIVTAQPEPFVCINQPVTYNLGASEPNGNTIVYSFAPGQTSFTNNVPYTAPYNLGNPINTSTGGATIDPVTGTVSYTPDQTGAWVIVIRMEEYDVNGNLVSVTNYDYQTYVINCNNDLPQPPAGGVSNISGAIVQNGPTDLSLCQGFEGCFDVVFSDPDAGDVLTVQSNLANVLPGATITQTGTNPITVSVCWTPVTTAGNVTLSFLVEDDACPMVGQNNFGATINVINPGVPSVVTTTETCGGSDEGTATITVAGNPGPFDFEITHQGGGTNATNTTGSFTDLEPGTYDYTVEVAGGCEVSGTFTIVPGPPMPVTPGGTNVDCNGGSNGTATVTPTGGTAPYVYVWSEGGSAIGQNTQTASGLDAGTYDVTVTDALGCTATAQYEVTEPTAITGTLDPTPALCKDDCNGEIDVINVSGGTAPYSYSLNNGTSQGGTNFSGLCDGPYQVDIIDDNGCELPLNTTITEPTALNISLDNVGDASCGTNSGSIDVSGTGGTAPYQFSIGGANQASGSFTGLAPGSYTVTITDDNGCTDDINATVGAVAAPTLFIDNQDNLACFGATNGEVILGTTGAIAPITYSLDGGPAQASNTFSNLSEGTYVGSMTDGNECTATVNITITQPTVLAYATVTQDASCNGVCDAEITVNANGGTPPYEYSSNNGATFQSGSNVLTGLCVANSPIQVVVRDDNGCTSNSTPVISEPAAITSTYNPTDPVCRDDCNGEIEVLPSGGTAPYTYNVDGGAFQGSNILTGLCSGDRTVIIEDDNGCQLTNDINLVNPPGIVIDSIDSSPSNCGFNDGMLEVDANGVNPPFQYSINGAPNQGTGVYNNLFAGAYEITVTDALGCQESEFFGVNDIQMDGELVDTTSVTCNGGSDGEVEVINLAGNGLIQFELDNSGVTQTNGTFNGLSAGSHIVTIYDAGFCVFTVPFTLLEPDEIQFNTNVGDIACNGGATGTIDFTNVTGGNGGYQYSIDGGFAFQASPNFNGLAAGTYNLVVIDQYNCSQTGTATINQATPIDIQFNNFDLVCNGDNSGLIQVVASGGTGTYTYSNDNGANFQASEYFVSQAAGTYDIVVMDAANCTETVSTTLTEPAILTSIYDPTDTECFGACDGEMEFTAAGGTAPYLYSIDNGVTTTTNNVITGICASTFTVVVEDDNGCTINTVQVINEPTEVTFSSVEQPSTCSNPNGEITITANGGTPGYTYSIDNGANFVAGNNFTGLAEDTYLIVVEDNNNCPATGTQIVTNEASPQIDLLTGTDPLCNGSADGTITVAASGGTGTLLYSINGGATQASNIFNGLTAGVYTVEITDDNLCTDDQNITLTDPPVLTFNPTQTPLACFQNSTGSINIVPNGGTPPYEYSFDNGATFGASPNHNFIAAGNYDMVVRDFNGCTETDAITVTEPPLLEFNSITTQDAICYTNCDGEIDLDVIGGVGPYTYNWVQGVAGVNDNTAVGLCTGNYDFIVTDANLCTISDVVFIDEPAPMQITSLVTTNVTCNGDCDGEIVINSPTAVQYSIDNGANFQASNTFPGLCDGDYDIVVQDAAGCEIDSVDNVWQPDPLTIDMRQDTTVCYEILDTIYAYGTGGIQPYQYTWSNGSNPNNFDNPLELTDTTTIDVVITDYNGCTTPLLASTINVIPLLDITVSADTTICPGGTATLTAQGVDGLTNYSYTWSDGQTGNTISVSPTSLTTYTATVVDQCYDQAQANIDVDLHILPQVNLTGDQLEGCAPLSVNFTNATPANQVGANCNWLIEGINYPGCNGPSHTFDDPGCYSVTLQVTSPAGCVNDTTLSNYICVFDNPDANFYFDPAKPTVNDNVVNFFNTSTGETSYSWTFPGFGASSDQNPTMTFQNVEAEDEINVCLEVTSVHGCTDEICKPVIIYDDFILFVPNAFTPDADEFNEIFLPVMPSTANVKEYELMIFNRWGEPVFESHNAAVGWDGTYRGELAKDDVYVWQIRLVEGDEENKRTYRGHVTLLK